MESSEYDRHPARQGWLRGSLSLVSAADLIIGVWALFLPRFFYDAFPAPGRHWVSALGPYDEHLVRDVGAFYLGFGVLLGLAAIMLERRLVQVSLAAWLVFAVLHFVFHLTQVHAFSLGDNLAQLGSLGFFVLLPLAFLVYVARTEPRRNKPDTMSHSNEGEPHG